MFDFDRLAVVFWADCRQSGSPPSLGHNHQGDQADHIYLRLGDFTGSGRERSLNTVASLRIYI